MNRFTDIDLRNEKLSAITAHWSYRLVSLEEALQPLTSQIEDLDRSIKAARRYCHYPSEHDLSHDESAAVYLYTMEGGENSFYLALNKTLRLKNRQETKNWIPFLKLFDSALSKLPTVRKNLWRGIVGDVTDIYSKGQILTWWSVSSCSVSIESIAQFLPSGSVSTLFMIEAINGKDISSYTSFPDEEEVLLGIGTELRVEGKLLRHAGGLHIIQLVELDGSDDKSSPTKPSSSTVVPEPASQVATGSATSVPVSNDSKKKTPIIGSSVQIALPKASTASANVDAEISSASKKVSNVSIGASKPKGKLKVY